MAFISCCFFSFVTAQIMELRVQSICNLLLFTISSLLMMIQLRPKSRTRLTNIYRDAFSSTLISGNTLETCIYFFQFGKGKGYQNHDNLFVYIAHTNPL